MSLRHTWVYYQCHCADGLTGAQCHGHGEPARAAPPAGPGRGRRLESAARLDDSDGGVRRIPSCLRPDWPGPLMIGLASCQRPSHFQLGYLLVRQSRQAATVPPARTSLARAAVAPAPRPLATASVKRLSPSYCMRLLNPRAMVGQPQLLVTRAFCQWDSDGGRPGIFAQSFQIQLKQA